MRMRKRVDGGTIVDHVLKWDNDSFRADSNVILADVSSLPAKMLMYSKCNITHLFTNSCDYRKISIRKPTLKKKGRLVNKSHTKD